MKNLFPLLLLLTPLSVFADEPCADLWWSRNHLFDQAGYCFASPLGQRSFDNSDCTSKVTPKLSPKASNTVTAIREEETRWECKINSKATHLDLSRMDLRHRLIDVAVNDGLESGCINYRGPDIAVYAGANTNTAQLGKISVGDNIGLAHYSMFEGWQFVSYSSDGLDADSPFGWISHDFWQQCEFVAG